MTDKDNPELEDDLIDDELEDEKLESEGEGNSETADQTDETETTDQGGEGEESGDDEDGKEQGKPFEDTDTPNIPTRNASYVIGRQKKVIEKLRSKSTTEEEEPSSQDDDENTETERTPKPSNDVAAEVARQLAPVTEKLASDAQEAELAELFVTDPEAKGYQRAIRAFMKHEAWSQVPAAAIYAYLSREHVLAQGAKRKQVADAEAAHTRGTGNSRRPTKQRSSGSLPSAEEIEEMTDDEIEELAQKVQTGKFAKK